MNLITPIEAAYDALPRVGGARSETVGPFVLFLRDGPGWPYYARPHLGVDGVTADDVAAVLARQRELAVPEAIEWVDDVTPSLLPAVRSLGLRVEEVPLMVLDPSRLPPAGPARLLDPARPGFESDMALASAVANLAFAAAGTAIGTVGPAERDAAVAALDPAHLERLAADIRAGHRAYAVISTPEEGVVAQGALQAALGAAEIVGVATLPSARRRGLGAAVSAALAHRALELGNEIVFLSAASEDVARVYATIGFERIGTACLLA